MERTKPSDFAPRVSDERLDEMIEWAWGVAVHYTSRSGRNPETRIENASWYEKWQALTELKELRQIESAR